ncbi:unnamed protein product [Calypogeia fissa]
MSGEKNRDISFSSARVLPSIWVGWTASIEVLGVFESGKKKESKVGEKKVVGKKVSFKKKVIGESASTTSGVRPVTVSILLYVPNWKRLQDYKMSRSFISIAISPLRELIASEC